MKKLSILTAALGSTMVLLSMVGFAMAATTTTTTGSVSETSSFVWTISSDAIDGMLAPGERQSTTVYGDNTQTMGGTTSYRKSFDFDTSAMNQGQYNFESTKLLAFDGVGSVNGNGRAISNEFVGIETMGMPVPASAVTVDPFSASGDPWIPAFHNTVNAGSSFDLAQGSVLTQAQTRTVTPYAGVPVALDYGIRVQGLGNGPAIGSAGAFMEGHLEEGRGNSTQKASDLAFSQQSSVSGIISRFDKTMTYESGINR